MSLTSPWQLVTDQSSVKTETRTKNSKVVYVLNTKYVNKKKEVNKQYMENRIALYWPDDAEILLLYTSFYKLINTRTEYEPDVGSEPR